MGAGPVAGVLQLHGDVPTHRMDAGIALALQCLVAEAKDFS